MKRKVIGIFLTWIGLALALISFSPNMTGFAISNSFVFRGGYFLFAGMILAVIGVFMTTLEDEIDGEILQDKDKKNIYDIATKTVEEIHSGGYGSLVFLDRSARVFNHLIRARWKNLYPDEKIPQIFFANIGREKSAPMEKVLIKPAKYNSKYNSEVNRYSKKVARGFDNKYFQNKKVLLIDEHKKTGETGRFATKVFEKAFPDSEVKYISMGDFSQGYSESMYSIAHMGRIPVKNNGDKEIFIRPLKKSFFHRKIYSEGYKKYQQLAQELKKVGERE